MLRKVQELSIIRIDSIGLGKFIFATKTPCARKGHPYFKSKDSARFQGSFRAWFLRISFDQIECHTQVALLIYQKWFKSKDYIYCLTQFLLKKDFIFRWETATVVLACSEEVAFSCVRKKLLRFSCWAPGSTKLQKARPAMRSTNR